MNGGRIQQPRRIATSQRTARCGVHHATRGGVTCEQVFLRWLAGPERPDEVRLDDEDVRAVPLTRLLGRVATSRRRLPGWAAAALGVPPGTTVGDGALRLLLAVEDPAGPRCPTYADALDLVGTAPTAAELGVLVPPSADAACEPARDAHDPTDLTRSGTRGPS